MTVLPAGAFFDNGVWMLLGVGPSRNGCMKAWASATPLDPPAEDVPAPPPPVLPLLLPPLLLHDARTSADDNATATLRDFLIRDLPSLSGRVRGGLRRACRD